jgi:hypothetical protein
MIIWDLNTSTLLVERKIIQFQAYPGAAAENVTLGIEIAPCDSGASQL